MLTSIELRFEATRELFAGCVSLCNTVMLPLLRFAILRRRKLPFVAVGPLLAAAAAVCLGMAASPAADFDSQHASALAANPTDVQFRLALAGGRAQFHHGEAIKVRYELTSDTPQKYRSGDLWYDLSDRSRFESFVSDRPGDSADPLADHWTIWETLYNAHVTRRLGSWKYLSQDPLVESWDLNEYLRFDKPGKYRIYAVTRHVVADWSPGRDPYAGGAPLASGVLEVEILPDDAEWEATQLEHAVETMTLAQRNERERTTAVKTIRYLQTPAALDAMVTHYTDASRDTDAQLLSGMIGYHDHAAAVKRMERQLGAEDFGVTRFYLFSLGVMKLRQAHPEISGDELKRAEKPEQKRWRRELFDVLMPYYEQLIPAAEKKNPRARALTVDTLFHTSALEVYDFEKLPLPPEKIEALRLRELAILPDLPPYEQFDRIANFGWAKNLPGEQVLPVLRKIYANPAGEAAGNIRQTRNYVLKDVNAISPEEGQRLLATAITEPHEAMNAREASNLPMTPSAELDNLLISKLEGRVTEEMKSASPLIGKFATPGILERVRAVYEVEKEAWPCDIEAGLLAYFLRVDPEYGMKVYPAAAQYAAGRSTLSCQRPTLLGAISVLYYSQFVENAAVAQLQDANPRAVQDAAEMLRWHPTAPAQAALYARFQQFHEEWKDFDPAKAPADVRQKWDRSNAAGLELALVRAIAQSQPYRRNAEMLEQLGKLCVTDACRAEVMRMMK